MELVIEKIVYPGRSMGRSRAGKTVFTDEGFPGERVTVEPIKEKKKYILGITREIISAETGRSTPRCDHYRICSPYQYIPYEEQLRFKTAQLKEILEHSTHTPIHVIRRATR